MINEKLFRETVKKWQGKYFTRSLGKDKVFLYLKKISKIEDAFYNDEILIHYNYIIVYSKDGISDSGVEHETLTRIFVPNISSYFTNRITKSDYIKNRKHAYDR